MIGADRSELAAILTVSQALNAQNGVTGLLWWKHDTFAQVLEGAPAAVDATIGRINRDRRHTDIGMVETSTVANRMFGQWSMAEADGGPDGAAGTATLVSFCAVQASPEANRLFNFLVDAGY